MTEFKPFSKKQLLALTWWCKGSPSADKNGIICDGAVRSGKTLCMSLSFVGWAFY
ncbi:MAG: PBSX family phage terminase large subunit, partial [Eubacterium sp.]